MHSGSLEKMTTMMMMTSDTTMTSKIKNAAFYLQIFVRDIYIAT